MAETNDAGVFMGALAEAVGKKKRNLTPSLRGRYGKEFKIEIGNATEEAKLYRAIEHIAHHWDDKQLTVGQALTDVERGGASVATTSMTESERVGGYEELFSLNPRQERVLKWIETVGKERALEQMREKHGQPEGEE